jgi:hypothetical protein
LHELGQHLFQALPEPGIAHLSPRAQGQDLLPESVGGRLETGTYHSARISFLLLAAAPIPNRLPAGGRSADVQAQPRDARALGTQGGYAQSSNAKPHCRFTIHPHHFPLDSSPDSGSSRVPHGRRSGRPIGPRDLEKASVHTPTRQQAYKANSRIILANASGCKRARDRPGLTGQIVLRTNQCYNGFQTAAERGPVSGRRGRSNQRQHRG